MNVIDTEITTKCPECGKLNTTRIRQGGLAMRYHVIHCEKAYHVSGESIGCDLRYVVGVGFKPIIETYQMHAVAFIGESEFPTD